MDDRLREAERSYLRNPGTDTKQALQAEWERLAGEGSYEHPLLPDERRDAASVRAICNQLVQEHGWLLHSVAPGVDVVRWEDDLVSVTWTRVSVIPSKVEPTMVAHVKLPNGLARLGSYHVTTPCGPDESAAPQVPRVLEHLLRVLGSLEKSRKAST